MRILNKSVAGLMAVATLVTAQPSYADKSDIGTVIGGILGGVLGNSVGQGRGGKIAGTIIGGVVGAVIGHEIGAALEEQDREALRRAQRRSWAAPRGRRVYWRGEEYGSRSGAYGSMYWEREGYSRRGGYSCRYYTSEIYARGRSEVSHYSVCRFPDGSWREVEEHEVIYGRGGYRPAPIRDDGYDNGYDDGYDSGYDNGYDSGDDGYESPRPPRPQPPRPQASRPQPRPAAPAPAAPLPEWILGQSDARSLVNKMKSAQDDEARLQIGRDFYGQWPSKQKFLTMDQLGEVVSTLKSDRNRLRMVKLLRPVTDVRFGQIKSVTKWMSTSESGNHAVSILKSTPNQNTQK